MAAHEDGKGDYSAEVGALSASGAEDLVVIVYLDLCGRGMIQSSFDSGAFSRFILSYGMNATIHLGRTQDPSTGQISRDLNRAKDLIDILEVLKTKTSGNLDKNEEKILDETLANLKLLYVKALSSDEEKKE